MKITNEEVRKRAETHPISEIIKQRRWRWIGHVLRMENNENPRITLTWTPEGRRNRGRPRETWRRTVEKERNKMGFTTWERAHETAIIRDKWKSQVVGPILPKETWN